MAHCIGGVVFLFVPMIGAHLEGGRPSDRSSSKFNSGFSSRDVRLEGGDSRTAAEPEEQEEREDSVVDLVEEFSRYSSRYGRRWCCVWSASLEGGDSGANAEPEHEEEREEVLCSKPLPAAERAA